MVWWNDPSPVWQGEPILRVNGRPLLRTKQGHCTLHLCPRLCPGLGKRMGREVPQWSQKPTVIREGHPVGGSAFGRNKPEVEMCYWKKALSLFQLCQYPSFCLETSGTKGNSFFLSWPGTLHLHEKGSREHRLPCKQRPSRCISRAAQKNKELNREVKEKRESVKSNTKVKGAAVAMNLTMLETWSGAVRLDDIISKHLLAFSYCPIYFAASSSTD